jgi:hypothetical protein
MMTTDDDLLIASLIRYDSENDEWMEGDDH